MNYICYNRAEYVATTRIVHVMKDFVALTRARFCSVDNQNDGPGAGAGTGAGAGAGAPAVSVGAGASDGGAAGADDGRLPRLQGGGSGWLRALPVRGRARLQGFLRGVLQHARAPGRHLDRHAAKVR